MPGTLNGNISRHDGEDDCFNPLTHNKGFQSQEQRCTECHRLLGPLDITKMCKECWDSIFGEEN